MPDTIWVWGGFIALILALLALDLGVLQRKHTVIGPKAAIGWTLFWIGLALGFNVGVYFMYEHHVLGLGTGEGGAEVLSGQEAALEFFTGYVIEKSLSLDNIFVIALIFTAFKIPRQYQHRVLFWGILGALISRGAMIAAGAALIAKFTWTIYFFGALLLFTSVRMLISEEEDLDPENMRVVKLAKKIFPVHDRLDGDHFFTTVNGARVATPLFLALLIVEASDIVFAIDSIPAIFAVTRDPFLVFTSNIFAILGLRSLYFALAVMLHRFHYLKESLVFLLAYVGVKMIVSPHYHIPTGISLAIIGGILGVGVVASLFGRKEMRGPPGDEDGLPAPETVPARTDS